MKHLTILLFVLGLASPALAASGSADLRRADEIWARRAEGQTEGRARPERAREAVEAYEVAISARPDALEAHWKLVRALWFSAEFATRDRAERLALLARGRAASEQGLAVVAGRIGAPALERSAPEELRERVGDEIRHDVAQLYFWNAIALGAWSRSAGLLDAVLAGVANRLHDATLRSIALDSGVEQGGALRLLSRLHAELPRVPFVSGWVDPSLSVPLAERAVAEYPGHPGNPYLLGLALLDHAPDRRAQGLRLVEDATTLEPRPEFVIEDLAIRIDASTRASKWARRP